MKSLSLSVCVFVDTSLWMVEAKTDEPGKSQTSAADPMIGKEPGQVRDDNGLKKKLVWCPAGEFTTGTPKTEKKRFPGEKQVEVTLTTGFWLGKHEVKQSEWKQVMKTEPWKGKDYNKEGADYPATFVSWHDVVDFCRKFTEQERQAGRLSDDWEFTLPTDAQWERACRAETQTRFSFGDDESSLGDYAWFKDNAQQGEEPGDYYARQVGQKKANTWGLCDMHGNLWEWCRDIYTEKMPGGRDPEVKPDEKTKDSDRAYGAAVGGATPHIAGLGSAAGASQTYGSTSTAFVLPSLPSGQSSERAGAGRVAGAGPRTVSQKRGT